MKSRGRIPSESWWALVLLWMIYALNANSRQLVFYVLPSITKEFNADARSIGLYTTLMIMATAVAAIPLMIWADKGGHGWRRKYRHLPIVLSYTFFTFLTGFHVLTATIGVLVGLQIISHALGGAGEAIEVTSLAEWWSRERRGLALGFHHTGFPWGTLIGGSAVGALLAAYGPQNWRLAFLLFPIVMIAVFGIYWAFSTQKRYASLLTGLARIGETHPLSADVLDHGGAPKGSLRQALRNPNISVIAFVSLMANLGYIAVSFWLPQYIAFVAHYSFAQAAAYSVIFTITGGMGQIVWGWISDRIGRKLSLIIVLVWLAVALYFLRFSYLGLGTLVAVQLFAGCVLNAPYTLLYAIAFDSTRPGTTGIAGAIINVGLYLGGIGPYVIGWLIGIGGGLGVATGYNNSLYFICGLTALAAVLTALFTRETNGWFLKHDRAFVSRTVCGLEVKVKDFARVTCQEEI
jgi:sugar phosphate permease